MKTYLLFLCAIFVITSCSIDINTNSTKKYNYRTGIGKEIIGNGVIQTINQSISSPIDKIVLTSFVDVELNESETTSVAIEADENLVEFVEVNLEGTTLFVGAKNNINIKTNHPLKVIVSGNGLTEIITKSSGDFIGEMKFSPSLTLQTSGSGDIEYDGDVDNLTIIVNSSGDVDLEGEYKNVDVSIASSGDVTIDGKAQTFNAITNSSGDVYGKQLTVDTATVKTSSSGDIYITTIDKVLATTISNGDIYIYGNPKLKEVFEKSNGDIYIQ